MSGLAGVFLDQYSKHGYRKDMTRNYKKEVKIKPLTLLKKLTAERLDAGLGKQFLINGF